MPETIFFRKHLRFFLLIAHLLTACSDHLEPEPSPSSRIHQSDQLLIPATVALPATTPGGTSRVATYYATGVQKYKAQEKPGSSPVTYEWVFVAPEADLYDAKNAKMGTHGAGPFWQLSTGDFIQGQAYAPPKTAPGSDPASIDWLLLMPKSGSAPSGLFQDVDYIQRIATTGGKAPATPPSTPTATADVPYTAVYRFSKINP